MKKLCEATTTGSTTTGGYNKPVGNTLVRRAPETTTNGCVCKNLPGKVVCGICSPKSKRK